MTHLIGEAGRRPRLSGIVLSSELARVSLLLVLVLSVTIMLVRRMPMPWDFYMNGWSGAFYSLVALERLRDGFFDVLGPQTVGVDGVHAFYMDHPPLPGILLAAAIRVLGVSEVPAHLLATLAMAGSAILFFRLVQRISSTAVAQLTLIAMVSMPMFYIYGNLYDDHGPLDLVSLIATLFFLERYLAGSSRALFFGVASAAISLLTDYLIVFLVAALVVASVVPGVDRKRLFRYISAVSVSLAVCGVAYLIYFVHYLGSVDRLIQQLTLRTGLSSLHQITIAEWLERISRYQLTLFSPFILGSVLLLGINLLPQLRRRASLPEELRRPLFWVVACLIFGASYVIIGNENSYVHDYCSIYLMPAYALLTGLFWWRVMHSSIGPIKHWLWLLAVPYMVLFSGQAQHPAWNAASQLGLVVAGIIIIALLVTRSVTNKALLALSLFACVNLFMGWEFDRTMRDITANLWNGRLIQSLTPPGSVVVTNANAVPQLLYYSGRVVIPNPIAIGGEMDGWDELVRQRGGIEQWRAFVRKNAPVYVLVQDSFVLYPASAVQDWLARSCSYERLTDNFFHVERCTS